MALIKVKTGGVDSTTNLGRRNLIINGAMQVAQRGTSAVPVGNGTFIVDRFKTYKSNDGAYTIEQSTDAPDGFSTSLKGQVTIADTSIAAGQYVYWPYYIEAKDLQHLSYGTSSAKTLTLSFWVKSSKTGVYTISVYKQDTTSYMFTHEYTISSANTWENKTITITPTAGGTSFITTSGGAIANDNGAGLILSWNLSFGSDFTGGTSNSWSSNTSHYSTTNAVNWMDSTSNDFYLTGVQLEVGETATPFEHRSYGEELALCQRYFQKISGGSDAFTVSAKGQGAASVDATIPLTVPLRASPTMNSINSRTFNDAGYYGSSSTTPTALQYSDNNTLLSVNCGGFSGLVNNEIQNWGPHSNELTIDAEL